MADDPQDLLRLADAPWNLVGDRYSPNLRKWLMRDRRWMTLNLPLVYQWGDGDLYIGRREKDDGWFTGSRLWGVLNGGGMGTVHAYPSCWSQNLTEVLGFWDRYATSGRCAIDTDHSRSFIGDETRWAVDGDHRNCLWCGQHSQSLHRWTETIDRSAWKPDPARAHSTKDTSNG
jgi:hypothetical protein